MSTNQVNYLFLNKYCKPTGINRFGYLTYDYKPYENQNVIAKITVEEETFKVKIVQYIGNELHFQMGNSTQINKTEYLSKKIHQFL